VDARAVYTDMGTLQAELAVKAREVLLEAEKHIHNDHFTNTKGLIAKWSWL
jgi:hypothetical protein